MNFVNMCLLMTLWKSYKTEMYAIALKRIHCKITAQQNNAPLLTKYEQTMLWESWIKRGVPVFIG